MKSRILEALMLQGLIIFLTGCASARLEIESSIYMAEPVLASRLSQADLLKLHVAVDAAESEAVRLKEARIHLSRVMLQAINDYRCLISKATKPTFICDDKLPPDLVEGEYTAKLDNQMTLIAVSAKEVRDAIVEYDRLYRANTQKPQETAALIEGRDRILAAARRLEARVSPLGPNG